MDQETTDLERGQKKTMDLEEKKKEFEERVVNY